MLKRIRNSIIYVYNRYVMCKSKKKKLLKLEKILLITTIVLKSQDNARLVT